MRMPATCDDQETYMDRRRIKKNIALFGFGFYRNRCAVSIPRASGLLFRSINKRTELAKHEARNERRGEEM